MTLYYYNDFESGLGSIDVYEYYSADGTWNNPVNDGTAVVSIVSAPVYAGSHAVACYTTLPTAYGPWRCAEVKKVVTGMSELYYGRAYYIPSGWDIGSPGWLNSGQIQESAGSTRIYCYLDWIGGNQFRLANDFSGTTTHLGGPWTIPRDRWFTVVWYLRLGSNGNVKMWLDGSLVVDHNENFSSAGGLGGGCDAGIYGGGLPAGASIYVDEFRIASTYEEALPVSPTPTQHNLSVTSNPSGLPFTLRKTV